MRWDRGIGLIIGSACLLLLVCATASAEDTAATATELTVELQQQGAVTPSEAAAIQAPLENMLGKGAAKKDLQNVVADLANAGVKGEDLKQTVDSMNNLVNEGENPTEAGNAVSQAAAQARAEGLKGTDLAARVREAVRLRKQQRNEAQEKIGKTEKDEESEVSEQESGRGTSSGSRGKGRGSGKGKK